VLIPFGLFGKTAFAAERVLGNVISSASRSCAGVIVGIARRVLTVHGGLCGNQRPSTTPWPLCLGRYRSLARHFRSWHCERHRTVDRNLVRELPSAPAGRWWRSWLGRSRQPVAPDSQAVHSLAVSWCGSDSRRSRNAYVPEDWVASRVQGARRSSARSPARRSSTHRGSDDVRTRRVCTMVADIVPHRMQMLVEYPSVDCHPLRRHWVAQH